MSARSTAASALPSLGAFFRRCYRRPNVRHGVENLRCDCLRVELPVEAQAKSSGRLMALHPVALHGRGCSAAKCGGDFECDGCKRLVGWCMGSGDDLGEEHCGDCFCDRLAVLARVKQGLRTRFTLNNGVRKGVWRRPPVEVASELCSDGFLELRRNGQFVLTERAKAALA